MKTLNTSINAFSFAERERVGDKVVSNKCGRDFLYFALNFYFPHVFHTEALSPVVIDERSLFGLPMPAWLAWTQIQFSRVASYLRQYGLRLIINGKEIRGYLSFVATILFVRTTWPEALAVIKSAITANEAVGVDISLGWGGLLDHVLFVYGYDDEFLYVFDTHRVAALEYAPYQGHHNVYRLPLRVVEQRWTRFGRVWSVVRV